MKKILFSVFAMAAMLFATSCSQEEDFAIVTDGSDANVSLSIELPQIATRADYSDGLTAQQLEFAFYDVADANKTPLLQGETTLTGGKATVNVNLATGKTYNILFWAQKEGNNNYSVNWNAQTLTVNYSNKLANNEENDAFYWFEKGLKVNSAIEKEIKLYRPFAQINLGTSDYADAALAGLTVNRSAMTVATLPNVLDFATGNVSGEVAVEFTANTIPGKTFNGETAKAEAFPVDGYEYLEMNYVLVGKDKATVNCEFFIYEDGATTYLDPTIVVSNVPVQRNYRTNIYGALLTDPANFNVTIVPDYEKYDYDVDMWDNTTLEEVTPNAEGVYEVENAAQLAWVAQQISADASNRILNATIQLTNDIYLEGSKWAPINMWAPETASAITIDGQGHMINDMTVEGAGSLGFIGSYASAGLLTIKDLTFANPVVTSSASFVGTVVGYTYGNVALENVTVTGATIETTAEKGIRLGGLVGLYPADAVQPLTLSGCVVENSEITGFHNLAGLVGSTMGSAATMTNCQSNNNTFYHRAENAAAWQNYDANGYGEGKAVKTGCTTEGNVGINQLADGVKKNAAGEYEISNANGMFWFADQVNAKGNKFAGKTVKLVAEVDLENKPWEPIGQTGATEFKGVFDGQGNAIYNLYIDNKDESGHCASGLFGWVESHGDENVTIKNVTVINATVKGHHNVAVIVGYVYGKVEYCTVWDAKLECVGVNDDANGDKCGVIAGLVGEDAQINGCHVNGSLTISAGRDAGVVVGAAKPACVTNCKINNPEKVSVTANGTSTGKNIRAEVIGREL